MPPSVNAAEVMKIATGWFDRADDRFVSALREVYYPSLLAPLVERWKRDPRPWAQAQILEYLRLPLNVPGHHVVVKRLYKHSEAIADHELVGAFLAAFDRLIRRVRKNRYEYDWNPQTRRSTQTVTEYLYAEPNSLPPSVGRNPKTGVRFEFKNFRPHFHPKLRLFSVETRQYLCRRAWRYFRRLGFQRPAEYVAGVTLALLRYVDDDLARPENLLDSRGLVQICFGEHSALEFAKPHVGLRPNRTLGELSAAPRYEPLWSEASSGAVLLRLLLEAPSRTVRIWAQQLLERHHRTLLDALPVETLFRILDHADAELQQFGATLLESLAGVDQWPLETWLRLLELRDPTALAIVCEQLGRRVAGGRLDVPQALKLATARATPVARIGFGFLRARSWESADDRRALIAVGGARCDAVAADLAKWTLGVIGSGERYDRDVVLALFDSLCEPMREATSAWFPGSPEADDDPVLWTRLIESPYEEVRLQLVEQLQSRATRPRAEQGHLVGLWSQVLLGVHRGGRQKLKAVDQLVDALIEWPERAFDMLPVLATAIRSIRGPEQRAGLAGVARLVDNNPSLASDLEAHLPELKITPVTSG